MAPAGLVRPPPLSRGRRCLIGHRRAKGNLQRYDERQQMVVGWRRVADREKVEDGEAALHVVDK
jgi:hypothetical protein